MKAMTCSTYSSRPKRPSDSGTSRALCQSVMYTSWSASMVRAVSLSSVAKWPDSGATISTLGRAASTASPRSSRTKRCSVQKAWRCTATSRTGTSRSPTRTESMPNEGRWCVSRRRENTSQAAASLRVAGLRTGTQSGLVSSEAPKRAAFCIGPSHSFCS